MTKTESIRALLSAGYVLIPLRGKIPIDKDWPNTPKGKYDEKNLATTNYGVLLKEDDLVVDVDPRGFKPGDRPLARLISDIGGPVKTFVVRTGGGGLHVYFKNSARRAVHNALEKYPGIEFKGGLGKQVVGPGSIHPETHREYIIHSGDPAHVVQMPARLSALIVKKQASIVERGMGLEEYQDDEAAQKRYESYLQCLEGPIQGAHGDDSTFKAACIGRDFGLSPQKTLAALSKFFNPRGEPPWSEDDLRAKVEHAYLYARSPLGNAHPKAIFEKIPTSAPENSASTEKLIGWKLGPGQQLVNCFENLLHFMVLPTAGLRGIFGYNEFTRRVEFINPAPWHISLNGAKPSIDRPIAVQDTDLARLRAHLARHEGFNTSVSDIVDAMVDVSHSRKFHPVRKYLENLKWDGQKRLDTWLIDYCGAVDDNQDYVKAVGRKTLCAAVARVFKPGIKFDHVLVLEGVQNIGKSGVCRILGGEWFADFKMNAAEKDTVQMMQGKWIVEMAELHAARQTDLDTLKAFLTRQVDEARFAYGRLPGQYPRQGIFIATYNPGPDGTYLKDDTGNRRWWPVRCNGVPLGSRYFNFAGLTVIRDQLFAEATARWKAGEALTMETVKLQDAATIAQSQRHAEHPWVDRIAAWLVERDRLPETSLSFLAPRDIFVMAMQGLDARYGRREQLEIARAMRELGWVPGFNRDKKTGRTIRGYRRVENSCAKVSTNKIDLDIFGDLV
jgi:predicted P-loop ATPase